MKIRLLRQPESFITLAPGSNIIKLFTDVIYGCSQKDSVPGRLFKPSIIFVCKAKILKGASLKNIRLDSIGMPGVNTQAGYVHS
jgi:hypothetical protein